MKLMNFSGKILNYVDGIPGSASDVTTEHTYNADGLPLTLKAKNASTGDQTTSFTYGTTLSDSDIARNDLLRNTEYPASSSGEEVEYTYNRLGQITSVTDSNGTVRECDYDGLGRLQHDRATTLASGVNGDIKRITRSYDLRGMVAKVTSYDNSSKTMGNVVNEVEREFNGFAQITHEYQSHSGPVNTSTTPYVAYSYANGAANHIRKTGMTTPDGLSLTYDYGSSGSMDDRVSRVRAIKEGSTDRVVYSYLGLDQRVEIEYDQPGVEMSWVGTSGGDGGDIYRGLDRFGRVIDMPWKKGMTELARTEYGYDRNSNRTWRNSPGTDQDEFYTYDDVNRLESRDQGTLNAGKTAISGTPVEEEVFDLDATANVENYLLTENGTTQLNQSRTFAANNENVLIAGSGTNVAFDSNGNMTTLPVVGDFSSNWTAAYDAWNRLVRINSGGSPHEDYLYDGLNRRVQKDDGSVRDFYYSDEWQIVEERIANATPADKTHVWGLRYIDDLVWIDDGATRQYALHDYYSIIAVTNTSGVVQQRYGFSAYGERKVLDASYTQTSSSATSDVGYGGYYEDAGTKMYQVRNRFLHPGLGRWINRDPIGYGGGINLYGYVNGNPVNGVDYFGLDGFWDNPNLAVPPGAPPPGIQCLLCGGNDSNDAGGKKAAFQAAMNAIFEGVNKGADNLEKSLPYLDVSAAKIIAVGLQSAFRAVCIVDSGSNFDMSPCNATINSLLKGDLTSLYVDCHICMTSIYAAVGIHLEPGTIPAFCGKLENIIIDA